MTDATLDIIALHDRKEQLLVAIAAIDARIESLQKYGHPETGEGTKDEARLMKEAAAAAAAPETTTAEPKAERAVKPAATRRKAKA